MFIMIIDYILDLKVLFFNLEILESMFLHLQCLLPNMLLYMPLFGTPTLC